MHWCGLSIGARSILRSALSSSIPHSTRIMYLGHRNFGLWSSHDEIFVIFQILGVGQIVTIHGSQTVGAGVEVRTEEHVWKGNNEQAQRVSAATGTESLAPPR